MQISHNQRETKFELYSDEQELAGTIIYHAEPAGLAATHTIIEEAFQGHGYGQLLVDALADYARAQGTKIIPACSYVKHLAAKHPQLYADVILPEA